MIDYGSHLLANAMLWLMYIVLAIAIGATLFSVLRSARLHSSDSGISMGVSVSRLAWAVFLGLIVCLGLTFLLGSTVPVITNGTEFSDAFWLRVADMFIYTSIILIALCSVSIVISRFRS